MKNKNSTLFFAFFLLFNSVSAQIKYKQEKVYKDKIALSVPSDWKVKENYLKFSNYEVVYNVKVGDANDMSIVTLNVYDSAFKRLKTITNESINWVKHDKLSDPHRKVQILDYGKAIITGKDVGYLKYTFENNNRKRSYGIEVFFCDSNGFYYDIEIYSLDKSVDRFKKIGDSIFTSIALKY